MKIDIMTLFPDAIDAMMGQSSSRYKGQHVYKTAMSQDMFDAQYAEWTAAMEG